MSVSVSPRDLSVYSQFYALTKPRVVQLIVFCALIGMVAVWPVNDLFTFFNRFLAGVTCAREA